MDNQNIAVLNVAAKFDEQSVKKVAKQFNKSMDSIESEFSGLSAQLNPEIVKKFDQALDKVNDKFKKINLSKYTTNVLKDLMDDAKGIEQKSASIQDFINKINALNEAVKGKKVKIFETFEPKQLEELFEFYDKIDKKQSDLIKKQEEFEKKAQSKIDSARSSKGLMQAYGSDIKNSNYQERINEIKSELSLSEKLTVQQEKTVEKYSKLLVLFDKMEQSKPAEGTIEAVKHSQELLNVVKEIREIEKTIGTFSKDKNFDSSKYTSSLSKVSGKEYYSDIEKMSEYSILQTVNNYKNTATAVIKDSISEIKINIEEYLKKTIELNRDAIVKAAEDAVEEIDEKIEKVSSKIKKDDSSKTKNIGTKKELTEEDITLYNKYFKISSLNAEELESEIKDVYDQLEKLYNKYSDNPDGILPEADRADFVGYYKQYIDLAKKIGDYDIDPDFSEAYDIFLRSNKTSNFANKLDEIKELVEAQKELKKSTDDLNESGASGGQNSGDDNFEEKSDNVKELEDSVQKLQEELEELKDRLVILENDNSFDSISTQVKELSDTFDKVNGKIEDLHSSINSIKDEKLDLRNIVFTAGDLDTPERLARKSDSFSQMIEAAIGNFGAFGSGKYVTRDVEDVASYGDDGRSYYAIDLSKYKNLLRFDSDEQIEDTIDFLLYLQKYLISITTSFRGFDNEISDFNVEKLEQEYHDVFNHLGLSIDQLKDFIKEITSQFSNLPVDDMNRINFDSQEYRSKDSYTTMLLKKLGYQGVDVSGSDEWDNVYQGSVIFDIDQLEPYVRKFKDAGEMIEFFDKKYEELESRKSKPPISDEVLSNIDALNEKLQKSLELYEKLEGRLQHIENLSKDTSTQKPETSSSPTLFEDSSGQLSFVEQTEKAVELIEEESGKMAMFKVEAEKATDSAIEGQKTLNDYLDKNIEGQMTLNDLMDKQDDHREVGQTEILLGADKSVQEAEQYKQVSKDTVSVLSDIGRTEDEIIAKIQKERQEAEANNKVLREHLVLLDDTGKVVANHWGSENNVNGTFTDEQLAQAKGGKVIHAHPGKASFFGKSDLKNLFQNAMYEQIKQVELIWGDSSLLVDKSSLTKQSSSIIHNIMKNVRTTLTELYGDNGDDIPSTEVREHINAIEKEIFKVVAQKLNVFVSETGTQSKEVVDALSDVDKAIIQRFKDVKDNMVQDVNPSEVIKANQTSHDVISDNKSGEEAKETAEEIEKADEQIEESNEEAKQSEEELEQTTVKSREKSSNATKKQADAIVKANEKIIESIEEAADAEKEFVEENKQVQDSVNKTSDSFNKSNSNSDNDKKVIESEEKVRKYRVANRNDVPKLKSKSDISDSQDISDISDVSEDISKIDALKKKIEELGFSAKETEAILKSIDDGSLFRIDWSNDDEYKKIQKLLSYLKEYGYLVKNVKEDIDAFSYEGNITTPEKEKEIQETSKAYKDLTKDVKKYFELKNKEVKNNLTETDRKKLAELEAEIKDATTAQNKYANATGEAAEAQKKFNAEVEKYKDNSGQNYIADVSKKLKSIEGADGKTKAYLDQIATIKAKIEELDKILPIDLTNQVEIDQLKKAQAEINKMMDSLSDKKFNSAVSQADTWTTRISQFLKQNSAAPKELLGQVENVQKRIVQLRNSVEGINEIQLKELTDEFKNLQAQITATGKTGISFGNKIVRKLKDLGAYLLTYVSFQDTIQVLRQGYEYVKEIDKQMIELEKVSDMSDARLAQSFDNSIESAKDLGSTISDVISATADWSRLGYNADAAEELAEVATIYKNVGDGIDISAANESLISTLQGFQMDASEAIKIVDAFNEVANRMPIDTAGIGEALQRSAASFNAANTTLNESIALITATNSVIQDPTRVGNMWKTVSARIRGAATELEDAGLETEGMVESTSKLRDLIKSMTGFDIMIDNDTYKSMKDIIIGIGKEWDNLKDVDQAALLEKLAGKTQANALAAALDNYEMIEESFEIAQESAGSAMKEQEKWEEGLEARTNKLKASLEELAAVTLDSDFLGGAIDAGRILIEVLANIIDKAGALPTLLTTIGSVFGLYRSIKGDGRSKMFDLIMNMPSAMIPLMDT